jgi:hypothetical protein
MVLTICHGLHQLPEMGAGYHHILTTRLGSCNKTDSHRKNSVTCWLTESSVMEEHEKKKEKEEK